MKFVNAIESSLSREGISNAVSVKQLPWTEEEDNLIYQFFEDLPQSQKQRIPWLQVAELINSTVYNGKPIRNNHNIRERWANYLNPQLKRAAWTFEEDCLIVENRVKKGKNWRLSSQIMKERNSHQIKNRFYQIFSSSLKKQEASLRVFKQVLNVQNLEEFIEYFKNSKDKRVLKQIQQIQDKKLKALELKKQLIQEAQNQQKQSSEQNEMKRQSSSQDDQPNQQQQDMILKELKQENEIDLNLSTPNQDYRYISFPQPQYKQQPQSLTTQFSNQINNPNEAGLLQQYSQQNTYPNQYNQYYNCQSIGNVYQYPWTQINQIYQNTYFNHYPQNQFQVFKQPQDQANSYDMSNHLEASKNPQNTQFSSQKYN